MVKAIVAKDFSSTVYGNVVKGKLLEMPQDRKNAMIARGLIEDSNDDADIDAMSVDDLKEFAMQNFEVKLDTRRSIGKLRAQVLKLVEAK